MLVSHDPSFTLRLISNWSRNPETKTNTANPAYLDAPGTRRSLQKWPTRPKKCRPACRLFPVMVDRSKSQALLIEIHLEAVLLIWFRPRMDLRRSQASARPSVWVPDSMCCLLGSVFCMQNSLYTWTAAYGSFQAQSQCKCDTSAIAISQLSPGPMLQLSLEERSGCRSRRSGGRSWRTGEKKRPWSQLEEGDPDQTFLAATVCSHDAGADTSHIPKAIFGRTHRIPRLLFDSLRRFRTSQPRSARLSSRNSALLILTREGQI